VRLEDGATARSGPAGLRSERKRSGEATLQPSGFPPLAGELESRPADPSRLSCRWRPPGGEPRLCAVAPDLAFRSTMCAIGDCRMLVARSAWHLDHTLLSVSPASGDPAAGLVQRTHSMPINPSTCP